MKYKAKENFSGIKLSMSVGEVLDITDDNIAKDLLKAGYIEEVKPAKSEPKEEEETTEAKPKKRRKEE